MASWSDMAYDVLEHLTSFLPLTDRHRFGAVCKSWREVVKQKQKHYPPPAPELPWLVLNEESESKKRRFYSLSEDRHYLIDVPELRGRYVCGSSFGWLFAVDIKLTAIWINPLTRECIELPPLPPYDYHYLTDAERERILVAREPDDGLSYALRSRRSVTFEQMQLVIVFKAALSHDPRERSDFITVILFGDVYRPAFWRPGDASWTIIEAPKEVRIEDVIFSNNGSSCYAVSGANEVFAVDFGPPHPKMTALRPWPMPGCRQATAQVYLAVFNEVLVVLERYFDPLVEEESHHITNRFEILEPEFKEKVIYEWGDDIEGYAFFVGTNSTIIVHSSQVSGCKRDSIYFTHITATLSDRKFGYDDLGVFDMSTNAVGSYYKYKDFQPQIGAPIWFTPNP